MMHKEKYPNGKVIFVGFSNGAWLSVYLMRKLSFDKNNLYFISVAGAHEGTKMANFAIKTPIKYIY